MKIHILGPAGSGATTLGRALAIRLGGACFDADDYLWLPTPIPYAVRREREKRQRLLLSDMANQESWVLSGSVCGWGDIYIPSFDLVVYLRLPQQVCLARLRQREHDRFGDALLPGGYMHETYTKFMEYAALYDEGDESVRSRRLHERWLGELPCPVLRIETDLPVEDRVELVLNRLNRLQV
jgi:adenylate kinase family enzyme